MRPARLSATLFACLMPLSAQAHGIWGHVHVTGWAAENMPDDELRAFLLDDPEVFNALLFGAVFTDTGYAGDGAAARAYSEHTHWEPFIEDFITWIEVNDPPPWTSLESKKRVAFLMGCASHGLQDSIFDSLFLHQVELRDGADQSVTDPGTDGFLVLDEHIRFIPEQHVPIDTLLELYEGLSEEVTQEIIEESVARVTSVYVNEEVGLVIAAGMGERFADDMPWGRLHYMDPAVPGSLRAEIFPTMRYQQAIWKRLHGQLGADDGTVFAYPELPRRLRSGDPEQVDSWVTFIFGVGMGYQDGMVELLDEAGEPVPFTQANTRWGASNTRLLRLQPQQTLTPGAWYSARMPAGVQRIDGQTTTEAYSLSFQVDCESQSDPACPELDEVPVANIDGLAVESGDSGDTAQPDDKGGACGCASGPRRAWGPWLGLAGLLALRRRPLQGSSGAR